MFGLTLIREKTLEYYKQTLTEILLLSIKINLDLKRFKNYSSCVVSSHKIIYGKKSHLAIYFKSQ